ncbi:MAG: hypothetical protein ACKOCK_11240, partial [Chloroflexota bacterium]
MSDVTTDFAAHSEEEMAVTLHPDQRPESDLGERPSYEREMTDNLEDLLVVLPSHVLAGVRALGHEGRAGGLVEIILDLGRRPEARLIDGEAVLSDQEVTREDLAFVA